MAEEKTCSKCGGNGACYSCGGSGRLQGNIERPDFHIADVDTGEESGAPKTKACPECLGTDTCQACQGSGVKN